MVGKARRLWTSADTNSQDFDFDYIDYSVSVEFGFADDSEASARQFTAETVSFSNF